MIYHCQNESECLEPCHVLGYQKQCLDCSFYQLGLRPANYPVPARIITFDYWPASETMDGQPALYCFDQYKPDRQLEWLKIGGDNF